MVIAFGGALEFYDFIIYALFDLSTSWPAVSRLEDPHHWPSLRQLEKYMAILGKKLVLSVESI
jgi:hypothetical protein